MAENDKGAEPTNDDKTPDVDGLKKALAAEREARKTAEKTAREASDRLAEIESSSMRAQVAASKGLTDEQAARLQGSTVEELEADADELLKAFGKSDEKPESKPGIVRLPQTTLKGGSNPVESDADNVDKVAERIISGT